MIYEFKELDKVTIKDIDAVIKSDFDVTDIYTHGNDYIKVLTFLNNIRESFGRVMGIGDKHLHVRDCENWEEHISKKFLFLFDDILVQDDKDILIINDIIIVI